MLKEKSLKKTLQRAMLWPASVTAMMSFSLYFYGSKKNFDIRVAEETANILLIAEDSFEDNTENPVRIIASLVGSSSVLNRFLQSPAEERILARPEIEQEILRQQKAHQNLVSRITLVDSFGQEIICVRDGTRLHHREHIRVSWPYVEEAFLRLSHEPEKDDEIVDGDKRFQYVYLKSFQDPESGMFGGVIGIEFTVLPFIEQISWLSRQGELSLGVKTPDEEVFSSLPLPNETEPFLPDSITGKTLSISMADRSILEVGISVSREMWHKDLAEVFIRSLGFLFFILIFVLLFTRAFTGKVLLQIISLQKAVRKVADGDYIPLAGVQGYREFSRLVQDFNHMAGRLKNSTVSLSYVNSILSGISESLLIIDSHNRVINSNLVARSLLGQSQEDLQNADLSKILTIDQEGPTEDLYHLIYPKIEASEFSGVRATFETNHRELIPVILNGNFMSGPSGEVSYIILTAQDARKSILVREHSQAIESQERAAESNRTMTMFLASVSHEIRNPMNAILGFSEILVRKVKNPHLKDLAEKITLSGKSLLTIINDLLDLSRVEAGAVAIRMAPLNISKFLKELHSVFKKNAAEKGLDLILDICPRTPGVLRVDEHRLRQIIFNLLGNAIKFTDKGFIKISCEFWESPHPGDAQVPCTSGELLVSVEDTGRGIRQSELDSVFLPFAQQSGQSVRRYGGTGLGLSIISKLAELMKGTVNLVSTEGKGSCFTVSFSEVEVCREDMILPDSVPVQLEYQFDPATVLIVDDSLYNREVLSGYLTDTGLSFKTADSGEAAIELMKRMKSAPFKFIFMDLKMGGMDGLQTARQIKALPHCQDVRIVLVTATFLGNRFSIEGEAVEEVLLKPVRRAAILACLSRYLPHSTQETGIIERKHPDFVSIIESLTLTAREASRFESQMKPHASRLQKKMIIGSIAKFADEVGEFARDADSPPLQEWARQLHIACDLYLVKIIKQLLSVFTRLEVRVASPGLKKVSGE